MVMAAILAAAMSNLSAALNALASTTVLGLWRPLAGRGAGDDVGDDKRWLRLSRYATVVWGVVLFGVALVALDGRWLRVNRSLCDIVGYSEPELLASDFQTITHPDDLEADLSYVRQLIAGEIRNYHMTKRYLHKQGHIVWILLSVSLMRNEAGEPLYFISQIQDITERKQAEWLEQDRREVLELVEVESRPYVCFP